MEGGNLFVNSYLAPIDVTKFTDDTNDFEGDIEKTSCHICSDNPLHLTPLNR